MTGRSAGYISQGSNNQKHFTYFHGHSPFNEKSFRIFKEVFFRVMHSHTSAHRLVKSCGEHCVYSHHTGEKAASGQRGLVTVDEPQLLRGDCGTGRAPTHLGVICYRW